MLTLKLNYVGATGLMVTPNTNKPLKPVVSKEIVPYKKNSPVNPALLLPPATPFRLINNIASGKCIL